jgi:hypothetical protein
MWGTGSDERYSEHLLRSQPINEKLAEAAGRIASLFDGSLSIPVTESAKGDKRVRAYILDEDGDLGYVEDAYYVGVAQKVGDEPVTYVAEQHYPYAHGAGRPTFFWKFKPALRQLMVQKVETAAEHPALDIEVEADNEYTSYFLAMLQDTRNIFRRVNYESRLPGKEYQFELPELQ